MSSKATVERERFLSLADEERKDILQTLGSRRGQSPAVLEKDVWACWVLETLFAIPNVHPMAFKGGTSLSKVYNAIERFSEDIDITLDYRALLATADPFKESITRSQLKKLTEQLRTAVAQYTRELVLPAFAAALRDQFGEGRYTAELSPDGERLTIRYRPLFQTTYLTDQILIEFGGRNAIIPNVPFTVSPYIQVDLPDLEFPEAKATVLAAERTFWEKATLIHVECNTAAVDKLARKCRHWYDIYKLARLPVGENAVKDRALLHDVVRHKQAFFYSSVAGYDACLTGKLRLIPSAEMLRALERDFKRMQDEGMFYSNPPTFETIISGLEQLELQINSACADSKPATTVE
jgi:hypothetical protein